jgi:hypothetical protein
MSQRTIGRHPGLDAPYGREPTTVEQIAVSQRRLSPQFPSIDEARERRHQKREAFVARGLMGLTAAFGLAAPFAEHPGFMAASAFACFVGFVATCIYAGNRQYRKMMS